MAEFWIAIQSRRRLFPSRSWCGRPDLWHGADFIAHAAGRDVKAPGEAPPACAVETGPLPRTVANANIHSVKQRAIACSTREFDNTGTQLMLGGEYRRLNGNIRWRQIHIERGDCPRVNAGQRAATRSRPEASKASGRHLRLLR